MADNWTQGSFAFRCTAAECALLWEAQAAGHALADGDDPDSPSAALLAAFPTDDESDPWSGFCKAFADPDFPSVGADFAFEVCADDLMARIACFSSMVDFAPYGIALLIQRCCAGTLAKGPIGFEWAAVCSKPRIGEFGGGWCAVFVNRIELETTAEVLDRALSGGIL